MYLQCKGGKLQILTKEKNLFQSTLQNSRPSTRKWTLSG